MDLIQGITGAGGVSWPAWPLLKEEALKEWLEKVKDELDELIDRTRAHSEVLERARDFEGEGLINPDLVNSYNP